MGDMQSFILLLVSTNQPEAVSLMPIHRERILYMCSFRSRVEQVRSFTSFVRELLPYFQFDHNV